MKSLPIKLLIFCLSFGILLIGCSEDDSTCTVNASCDDGNNATTNDVYDSNCDCKGIAYESFTDSRDGQTYKTIKISSENGRVVQEWFAENLNYTPATGRSWCLYDDTAYCNIYGRLYDWETAINSCPAGWHIPTDEEWTTLTDLLGGEEVAGGKLKEAGFSHWDSPNEGATNSSGFTGLPAGFRNYTGDYFGDNFDANWWSATAGDNEDAWSRNLGRIHANVKRLKKDQELGFSVRCIRD